jgi:hypothetical protein
MANKWNGATARTRQAERAVMSPAAFMALVVAWGGGLVLLLFVSILARYLS